MTVKSGFFNSVSGDRTYTAEDMGNVFNGMIDDGVHKDIGTNFFVTAAGGLNLSVGEGQSWFDSTWLINDDEFPVTAPASHVALPRIDAIVLEMDRGDSIREGAIKYVQGTAGSVPDSPTMVHDALKNQYPVAYISRAAGSTTILQSHITYLVGTPVCPFAANRLLDRNFEPSWMHRNVFRGKNLGATYTPAQKAKVVDGSFEDLFVGDYWEAGGRKYRIADINYFLTKGQHVLSPLTDKRVMSNHLVIMPDAPLVNASMYVSDTSGNAAGYMGSQRSNRLSTAQAFIEPVFGARETWAPFSDIYSTAVTSGKISGTTWFDSRLELPNVPMMLGASWFENGPVTNDTPVANTQLSLFRLAPWFINSEDKMLWTRDIVGSSSFAIIGMGGNIDHSPASMVRGWRPFFLIR